MIKYMSPLNSTLKITPKTRDPDQYFTDPCFNLTFMQHPSDRFGTILTVLMAIDLAQS